MITLSSQVEFVISITDLRPGLVQPAYTLFSFTTEFAILLALVISLLALGRLWRSLWVSIWDWLFVDWGQDWALICEATRLLLYPRGRSYVWTQA